MSYEEGLQKVKKTVGWYNHHGGLNEQIIYKNVRSTLEAINPKEALKLLKGLEEKGSEIRNPTAWLKAAAEKIGPDLDVKVKRTILWYNQHGGLAEEIRYDEVRGPLSNLPVNDALEILKGLEGKTGTIRSPTAWICKAANAHAAAWGAGQQPWGPWPTSPGAPATAAWGPWAQGSAPTSTWAQPRQWQPVGAAGGGSSGGKGGAHGPVGSSDDKVKKTVAWYNRNGGLVEPINYDMVAPALATVGTMEALKILKGLDGKGAEIANPTAWICKAAQKVTGAA